MTRPSDSGGRLVWLAGGVVAAGAGIATAHGLYEVAVAARVPAGIAWIYPIITDGLALVAYAATSRLTGRAARYAWAVVVTAAGLSGLAQATLLAAPATAPGGPPVDPGALLRFGVGAWPAIAAAVVAHLLYLLSTLHSPPPKPGPIPQESAAFSRAPRTAAPAVQAERSPADATALSSERRAAVTARALPNTSAPVPGAVTAAGERARQTAEHHRAAHGRWPSVRTLAAAAEVSTGTAHQALTAIRDQTSTPSSDTTPTATPSTTPEST